MSSNASGTPAELQLAPRGGDGTLRPYTTMWVVRVEDELYIRSAGGPARPWYRQALATGAGRLRGGGVEHDVTFGAADPAVHDAIDAAYHAKYDRDGASPVSHVRASTHTPSPSASSAGTTSNDPATVQSPSG